MGIHKKIGLIIGSVLIISFILLFILINYDISKNNDILVSSIVKQQEQSSARIISDLNSGFEGITSELKGAGIASRKILSDIYISFYDSLSQATLNQIFPLVANFDYNAANAVVEGLLKNSPEISWIRYSTSENPSDEDIQESGKKQTGDAVKMFTHQMKDEFGFVKLEIQVTLSGMASLNKLDNIFKTINTENKALLSSVRQISRESVRSGNQHAIGISEKNNLNIQHHVLIFFGISFVLINIALFFTTRRITGPILKAVDHAKIIAKGDLTRTLDIKNSDETGILAKTMNEMSAGLNQMFSELVQGMAILSSSSTELSAISTQMYANASEATDESARVSVSAQKMNSDMTNVAASSEQTSVNMQKVSAAVEEMSLTIRNIVKNTENGRLIAKEAVVKTEKITDKVHQLGHAAERIGTVTQTIAEISEQTNLLALNATIEAARAGEAGKGFAVIANEIKDLAKQTDDATRHIGEDIRQIQDTTRDTVKEIELITGVIHNVDKIVNTIDLAVERQSNSTQEIAVNVNHAASGMEELNNAITVGAEGSKEITNEIVSVSQASKEILNSSAQIRTSAEDLSCLAEQIHSMTDRFLIS